MVVLSIFYIFKGMLFLSEDNKILFFGFLTLNRTDVLYSIQIYKVILLSAIPCLIRVKNASLRTNVAYA